MEKLILVFSIVIFAAGFSTEKNPDVEEVDPCSKLVDGVYMYPTQNPDSTLTKEEKKKYWNIQIELNGNIMFYTIEFVILNKKWENHT